ncbi:hypothetical protein QYE76_044853 [Lolium multiflorum]|uniref:Transposase-associated domain-containing protein n=1 Tax=Lolium multiflorum TaxID=4521 RepID=A0AAD8TJD2_LOLMU|nr:hypothetical protein QYE76_044853 [Lolium multiflorum]
MRTQCTPGYAASDMGDVTVHGRARTATRRSQRLAVPDQTRAPGTLLATRSSPDTPTSCLGDQGRRGRPRATAAPAMDRSWITDGTKKFTTKYMAGVRDFMKFAQEHLDNTDEPILCPCKDCLNLIRQDIKTVEDHCNCSGMSMTYTRWNRHGEDFSDDEGRDRDDDGAYDSDNDEEEDNGDCYVDDSSSMIDELQKSGNKGPDQIYETEYYGVLQEVLELQYGSNKHGDRSVYLFRCDWFDLASRGSKIKDDGYFKSVNTSVLWFKNSPFILASQAETCFYLEDTKFGDPWKVVQKFSHRHMYDVPELEDGNDDAFVRNEDAYQEDEGSVDHTFHDVVDLDEEAEVEAEEDDHRADEVVRIHDARTIRELENGEDSPNVDMDMSEDELQNEEESLIMEENIHDDEGKNSEEDSDVD